MSAVLWDGQGAHAMILSRVPNFDWTSFKRFFYFSDKVSKSYCPEINNNSHNHFTVTFYKKDGPRVSISFNCLLGSRGWVVWNIWPSKLCLAGHFLSKRKGRKTEMMSFQCGLINTCPHWKVLLQLIIYIALSDPGPSYILAVHSLAHNFAHLTSHSYIFYKIGRDNVVTVLSFSFQCVLDQLFDSL